MCQFRTSTAVQQLNGMVQRIVAPHPAPKVRTRLERRFRETTISAAANSVSGPACLRGLRKPAAITAA
jgi:hypothetical protein